MQRGNRRGSDTSRMQRDGLPPAVGRDITRTWNSNYNNVQDAYNNTNCGNNTKKTTKYGNVGVIFKEKVGGRNTFGGSTFGATYMGANDQGDDEEPRQPQERRQSEQPEQPQGRQEPQEHPRGRAESEELEDHFEEAQEQPETM